MKLAVLALFYCGEFVNFSLSSIEVFLSKMLSISSLFNQNLRAKLRQILDRSHIVPGKFT